MITGPVGENVLGFGRIPVEVLFNVNRITIGVVGPCVISDPRVLAEATFERVFTRLKLVVGHQASVVLDHIAVTPRPISDVFVSRRVDPWIGNRGLWVHTLSDLHVRLLVRIQTSVIKNSISIATRSITKIANVLGMICPRAIIGFNLVLRVRSVV